MLVEYASVYEVMSFDKSMSQFGFLEIM